MLCNIYLTLTEPTNGSTPSVKLDAVPAAGKLTPHQEWVKTECDIRGYAQVNGPDRAKTYMGIIAQYDSVSTEYTILKQAMRNTRINIPFLKECAPII